MKLLKKNKMSITCAESCTGGLLAGRIVNVAGASSVFRTGYVTYANQAKRRLLGVKKSTLREFGAVSTQTAKEMASGALAAAKADVAVSITGIAGPDGGTARKPVGLVYIGCSVQGHTIAQEYRFSGNREKIRDNAVSAALTLTRRCILENCSKKE